MQEEPDSEHGETDGVTVNCTPEWSISKVDYEKQTV